MNDYEQRFHSNWTSSWELIMFPGGEADADDLANKYSVELPAVVPELCATLHNNTVISGKNSLRTALKNESFIRRQDTASSGGLSYMCM